MTSNGSAEPAMFLTCAPTRRLRRLAATLLGLAATLPAFGGQAQAESDRGAVTRFFDQESARVAPQATSPDVREPAARVHIRPYRAESGRGYERHVRPAPAVVAVQKPPAANPHRITVAVFGDRMGGALAAGLQENDEADVTVLRATSDDAGLTRPDFAAWLQSIHDGLPAQHAAAAVMVVGSNDRAPLQEPSGPIDPGTPAWQALYGTRVDAVAKLFHDAHVPLIWVGLPAVRNPEATADYVRLNGIVRDHASRNGAAFIDSWGGFTDDAGRYSPEGPDVDGQTAKLRRADGFGFTRAGARKLASFVEPDLTRLARHPAATPAPPLATLTIERARDFDAALDIDVNAQIRREAARDGTASIAEPARQEVTPEAPAAGPVMPLTAPPSSPDGQLAALPAAASDAGPLASLGEAPVTPKPGRTDDFSWPKP